MFRATIPSLFLRFVLILQYYVLENITLLTPYFYDLSLFVTWVLIFCGITNLNTRNI